MTNAEVVLVTGAGGALGGAVSRALVGRGKQVALTDISDTALSQAAQALPEDRVVGTWATDLTEWPAVDEMVQEVFGITGQIDACVNIAGVEEPVGPTADLDLDAVRQLFDINVFGVLAVMRAVLPLMAVVGRGAIVNIASGAGLSVVPLMAAYSASKHAVIGLTRSVALEVAGSGICVNAICPGCIESPMMERIEHSMGQSGKAPVSFLDAVPVGRFATADEIAEFTAYIAVEAPRYINGAALVIDGGLNA